MRRRSFIALVFASCSLAACAGKASSDPGRVALTVADARTEEPATQPTSTSTSTQTQTHEVSPPPSAPAAAKNADAIAADEASEPASREARVIGARHVLIQWMGCDRAGITVMRSREQALALAEDVLRRARAGQDLGKLAIEYSDEPNAGARGGSLGRFARGQMVPAFEAAAFKLRVGQISGIVETGFGFHIIQRTE